MLLPRGVEALIISRRCQTCEIRKDSPVLAVRPQPLFSQQQKDSGYKTAWHENVVDSIEESRLFIRCTGSILSPHEIIRIRKKSKVYVDYGQQSDRSSGSISNCSFNFEFILRKSND